MTPGGTNRKTFTVSQIARYVKNLFDADYFLKNIFIRGEVSNCKYHSSGHIYFTLKDASAGISCIMFARSRRSTDIRLGNGMEIIAGGSVTSYGKDGRYELIVTSLMETGVGELYRIFEQRKKEFAEMGMFAPQYKKPIPKYVSTVGVVTAPTGAAIHDIISVTQRRNPSVQLILVPALVQGEGAAHSIARAVEFCDSLHTDVMIVGRGGGSYEDLWAFNEEEPARAVFRCETPVISAVGHEIDFTIMDFVADLRAPTPSAAAELAVFDLGGYDRMLLQKQQHLTSLMESRCAAVKQKAGSAALSLRLQNPGKKLAGQKSQLEKLDTRMRASMTARLLELRGKVPAEERLASAMAGRIRRLRDRAAAGAEKLQGAGLKPAERLRRRLEALTGRLSGDSPLARMAAGYAFVTDQSGHPVCSAAEIPEDRELRLYMKDGRADVTVHYVETDLEMRRK
ncbi:MAG: exodeoxyribonuclease VII large subunit [Lachnospiraceae bacterium]|jgi:exodeoxyribonuclease VII large subunit